MLIALTRAVPPSIVHCELTHLERTPIDVDRAVAQHAEYERALARLGCRVQRIAPEPDMSDSVFVEDTAVVLDNGVAIITRPGAESRRGETRSMAAALAPYRELASIEDPGTLDGGDVLSIGDTLYVGLSARTNEEGIRQLRRFARVVAVPVTKCLHLKSAVTAVGDRTLLINSKWIEREHFAGFEFVEAEQANALRIGDAVLYPGDVPMDELAKAEGALTCCSVIFHG
ncbi:MAG TPA: arginine deiminase family protein [Thermoanaerobaculia bacterium]|jgi:dimethylargininase|nr:arginine deiminase family protein [Thermoanaerobaculia bacterium]